MHVVKNPMRILVTVILVIALVFAFTVTDRQNDSYAASMSVSSKGIEYGVIADKYGIKGKAVKNGIPTCSIPLSIKNPPKGTKYYAVYMYDPDAKNFTHWIAVNYKSKTFPENASKANAKSMIQGKNGYKSIGYGGPNPPKTHTYTIKVYALKSKLNLKKGFTKKQFLTEIRGKVLGTVTITGKYSKK